MWEYRRYGKFLRLMKTSTDLHLLRTEFLGGSATVRLYSDEAMTSQIGSDYTISDNTSSSGSEHSFFGFYDSESSIRGVKIIHAGTAMFGVDDVTLAVTPDPVTGTVILLGTIFPPSPLTFHRIRFSTE